MVKARRVPAKVGGVMVGERREPTRIRSVERVATFLSLVASTAEAQRAVKDLAAQLGTSTGTAYHVLNTLIGARLRSRDGRPLAREPTGTGRGPRPSRQRGTR